MASFSRWSRSAFVQAASPASPKLMERRTRGASSAELLLSIFTTRWKNSSATAHLLREPWP